MSFLDIIADIMFIRIIIKRPDITNQKENTLKITKLSIEIPKRKKENVI